MFQLNKKIANLTPYEPISGSYRIRLDANESFLSPDDELLKEIEEAVLKTNFNRYPDPLASELCEKFASYYGVDKNLVCAGNGSDEIISIVMNAFLEKGNKILTLSPDFSMYSFYAEISEAQCITLEKPDYKPDIDKIIETANREDVRIIIFSNPCNPTSVCMAKEDVLRIVEETKALVIADEAYMDFAEGSVIDCIEKYDNLAVLKTCSKAFGMAAIRLGFIISNAVIVNAVKAVKSPYNVNSLTQNIGCALFSNPEALRKCTSRICSSRDILLEGIEDLVKKYPCRLKIIAADANFISVETTEARRVFEYLKDNGIVVRCFTDMLRLTAGRNHENKELILALNNYFSQEQECEQ